jgi:hypothetical protein
MKQITVQIYHRFAGHNVKDGELTYVGRQAESVERTILALPSQKAPIGKDKIIRLLNEDGQPIKEVRGH